MRVSYKSRFLRLSFSAPITELSDHGQQEGGIYGNVFIATIKAALIIVTLKSFWNFLESFKELYQCDISTIVSNDSKYCRFSFFSQIMILL